MLRSIRSTKNTLTLRLSFEWVKGHADRYLYLLWWQMTLEQQLNAKCDNLVAKAAIDRTIRTGVRQGQKFLLPNASAALFVNGVKLTSSIENAVRFGLGKEEANRFLVHDPKAKWTQEQFDQGTSRAICWRNCGGQGWQPSPNHYRHVLPQLRDEKRTSGTFVRMS